MLHRKRLLVFIAIILVLSVVSGCSGGGGPDDEPEDYGDYEEYDDITEYEVPLFAGDISDADLREYSDRVLNLANIERRKAGVAELSAADELTDAAFARAGELVTLFSHKRPDGSSCFTVYAEFDVSYRAAAENIAAGQLTPEEAMNSWMNSTGHKANILNEKYSRLGVGVAAGEDGTLYWCMNFTN